MSVLGGVRTVCSAPFAHVYSPRCCVRRCRCVLSASHHVATEQSLCRAQEDSCTHSHHEHSWDRRWELPACSGGLRGAVTAATQGSSGWNVSVAHNPLQHHCMNVNISVQRTVARWQLGRLSEGRQGPQESHQESEAEALLREELHLHPLTRLSNLGKLLTWRSANVYTDSGWEMEQQT